VPLPSGPLALLAFGSGLVFYFQNLKVLRLDVDRGAKQ